MKNEECRMKNEECRMKNEEWELLFLFVKREEGKIALTQLLNEECRMKNEEFGLRSSACGFSKSHTQENKTNSHSSFFIFHSSFIRGGLMFYFP